VPGSKPVPVVVRVNSSPGHKVQGVTEVWQPEEVKVEDWLNVGHWDRIWLDKQRQDKRISKWDLVLRSEYGIFAGLSKKTVI
jgi:hypothetical protein